MLIELCPSWSFTQLEEIRDGLLINLSKVSQLNHIHTPSSLVLFDEEGDVVWSAP